MNSEYCINEHGLLTEKFIKSKGCTILTSKQSGNSFWLYDAQNKTGKNINFIFTKYNGVAQTMGYSLDLSSEYRKFLLDHEPNYKNDLLNFIKQQIVAEKNIWSTKYDNESVEQYTKRRQASEKRIKKLSCELIQLKNYGEDLTTK